jgi:hypothetical protein
MAQVGAPLDVSEAFDPLFLAPITVMRRSRTVNDKGRTVVTERAFSANAVVMPAPPNDLQRLPESEWTNKALSIHSLSRLQGNTTTTLPDHILWNNNVYVVSIFDDYSQWGRGFCHVVAIMIDPEATAPIPDPLGNA